MTMPDAKRVMVWTRCLWDYFGNTINKYDVGYRAAQSTRREEKNRSSCLEGPQIAPLELNISVLN